MTIADLAPARPVAPTPAAAASHPAIKAPSPPPHPAADTTAAASGSEESAGASGPGASYRRAAGAAAAAVARKGELSMLLDMEYDAVRDLTLFGKQVRSPSWGFHNDFSTGKACLEGESYHGVWKPKHRMLHGMVPLISVQADAFGRRSPPVQSLLAAVSRLVCSSRSNFGSGAFLGHVVLVLVAGLAR
jgi:hypothetical protein